MLAMDNLRMRTLMACTLSAVIGWNSANAVDTLYDQRFKAWEAKAQAGDASAQYHLGNAYLRGTEVARDYDKALQWFQKAAEQDSAKAQYKLGYMYFKGDGVGRNYTMAAQWLRRSAQQDYSPAQFYLGRCYADGLGVEQNYEKALYWYTNAAADNYTPAKPQLAKVRALIAKQEAQAAAKETAPAPTPTVTKTKAAPAQSAARTTVAKVTKSKQSGRSKTTAYDAKAVLLKGGWMTVGDEPARHMPSKITSCKEAKGKITCESSRLKRTSAFARIDYVVLSQFGHFRPDGSFMGSYRSNVLFVLPDDPDNPDPAEEDVPTTGIKPPTLLRCKVKDEHHIECANDNFRREKFVRK